MPTFKNMIASQTITFLKDLQVYNNKEWMEEHNKQYLVAKTNFEGFVGSLMAGLREIGVELALQEVKNCTFRINRDVRFSKNKAPYKTNMGAFMCPGGKKSGKAGYYFHLGIDESFAGGGLYMPEAENLKKIRQEIDYNFEEFKGLMEDKKFKKTFDSMRHDALKNPPKGYDAENPAVEYLKYKSFAVSHQLNSKDVTSKSLVKDTLQIFQTMKPMVDFLNRGMD